MNVRPITRVRQVVGIYAAGIALAVGTTLGLITLIEATSVNPETAAMWVAGYGLELNGPGGVALVQCYQSVDVGLTTVEC